MPPTATAFVDEYASAFGRYRLERNETMLHAAYELGRAAVERELSVLDLAVVHHDVLAAMLATTAGGKESEEAARIASNFFLETLSAFEMVQRGFRETREAAAAERRQAELLRRLSSFLSDASLAVSARDSERELLQLVAEQATELLDAEYCVAAASLGDHERAVVFTAGHAGPHEVPSWVASAADKWRDRPAALRASSDDVRHDPGFPDIFGPAHDASASRNALAARLVALDGTQLGFVQLFNRMRGEFNEVDEAVLVHLAQMTSAALERARFYRDRAHDTRR